MSRLYLRVLASVALAALTVGSGVACATVPAEPTPQAAPSADLRNLLNYVRNHGSTGFIVIQNGALLIDETWAAPEDDRMFANFVYGQAADGGLLEDVASQQKSFVAVLAAIAVDKGLLDVERPVSAYLGSGWSQATPDQEARIRVIDILTMSSGLDERFGYTAEPGTTFFYNTPVYAVSKRIVAAAAGQPLDVITREWLTAPIGMANTEWRRRPAALASVGNDTGLVTTPRDVARFGLMILHGGVAQDGTRVVSEAQLNALFARSETNPAYGRLWWLNGGEYVMRPLVGRSDGPLIDAAPADLVGALGAFDRRLYVVPSRNLVVVRTGAATNERDFDQQLWLRLMKVIG
ncbi:serine hydrolase domain-containing protein [Brevundimonas lenta]|uniref:CubicO group peptidase (Beta-lactamase class C family) n=1 Tax=Brevundimonas lenta TaxID=424796 RepID=A0A7W6NNY7_9CAUL|nr:serine hydrolase [Brevundimonas lenta]MBB4082860.1 CubicO group peptidase (beta-lactamase class C family) [Brevundimonas lenta]